MTDLIFCSGGPLNGITFTVTVYNSAVLLGEYLEDKCKLRHLVDYSQTDTIYVTSSGTSKIVFQWNGN